MGLREVINQKPWLVGIPLILLVLVVGWSLLGRSGDGPLPDRLYFFDLNTQQLRILPASRVPPYESDGETFVYGSEGTAGSLVEAVIMSCGETPSFKNGATIEEIAVKGGKLVYLRRYPIAELGILNKAPEDRTVAEHMSLGGLGHLYASPAEPQKWYPLGAPQVQQMLEAAELSCDITEQIKLAPR